MKSSFLFVLLLIGITACKNPGSGKAAPPAPVAVMGAFTDQELPQFTALGPIDTHVHVFRTDPEFVSLLSRLNLHLVNILVVDDQDGPRPDLAAQSKAAWSFIHTSNGRAVMCTTFDPYKVHDSDFARSSTRWLEDEFSQGAIAVKLWKNVGMEIKDAKGNYLLPDNAAFTPIYRDIAAHRKTLIAHVADPSSAWEPENPASPDYSYYKEHPVWYMHNQPNPASKEQILAARDHVLEQVPSLRMVGAHLGSMEASISELAAHLDKYPNFAVDLAARMPYIMLMPRANAIDFLTHYQDRLIYATDLGFPAKGDLKGTMKDWEETYARDWRFLATNDIVEYGGRKMQGLALPTPVLHRLYHDNAVQWFPGVMGAKN